MRAHTNALDHLKPLAGVILSVAAIAGTILAFGGEEYRKAYGTLTLVLSVHWVIILFLMTLANELARRDFPLPSAKRYLAESEILLVENKPWLGMGSSVSVFLQDSEFERLICNASVLTVQQNGLVQLKLLPSPFGMADPETINRALSGPVAALIIKPGASGVLDND